MDEYDGTSLWEVWFYAVPGAVSLLYGWWRTR
jgi:hypothetical protein